jgi:hypothetical protein
VGTGQRGALQDEEGRQRHQEAGQAGVDDEETVDQADAQRGAQRRQECRPHVPAGVADQQRGDQRTGHPHDTDGEVELAGDQQQRHRDPADAEQRRRVEHGGEAAPAEQVEILHREDDDREQQPDQGGEAGAGQRMPGHPAAARQAGACRAERGHAVGDHRTDGPVAERDVGSGGLLDGGVLSVHYRIGPLQGPAANLRAVGGRVLQGWSRQRTRSSAYQVQRVTGRG